MERPQSSSRPDLLQVASFLGGDVLRGLEELSLPTHIVDPRGRFRWQNEASIAFIGDRRNEPFIESVAPEARQATLIEFTKKVLGSVRATDFETVALLRDGSQLPVSVHSVGLGDNGQVVGVLAIVTPARRPARPRPVSSLTPRQHEMLLALAEGRSTAEIAAHANLSIETVRNHIRALLQALGVHSRLEAVAEGRRRGLVES